MEKIHAKLYSWSEKDLLKISRAIDKNVCCSTICKYFSVSKYTIYRLVRDKLGNDKYLLLKDTGDKRRRTAFRGRETLIDFGDGLILNKGQTRVQWGISEKMFDKLFKETI